MTFLMDETAREDKGAEDEEGRTVLVGIKPDAGSRELLTWALVNVAQTGDRVIALHVIRSSAEVPDSDLEPLSLISLEKELNAVVAVYEGFCNLKQIDLKLKISRGSSVRKVLVQEAISVLASKLIVGVSKSTQGLSYYSITVAKYCAKKISGGCLVLAVNNGKIIFQKEAAGDSRADEPFFGREFVRTRKINGQTGKDADPKSCSLRCLPAVSKARLSCDKIFSYAANLSSRFYFLKNENCPLDDSLSEPPCSPTSCEQCHTSSESGEGSLSAVSMEDLESPGCIPMLIWELPQRGPGWPLLYKAVLSYKKDFSQSKQKKASAVRLASSRRSTSSAAHPDCKQAKSDAVSKSDCNGEVEAIAPVIPKELLSLQEKYSSICKLFSCKELEQATSNFSPENIIGKGGNSRVYKGRISDGKELAVKIVEPSDDALNNFISEIEIMSNLHHKNIISLTGFCFENNSPMLVYDFLSRGSLEDNLHGGKGGKFGLCWAERYKIAVGVAEALKYLHESSSAQHVIHRDVKSSNILLSDDFEPQLSDFGLAQLASSSIQNMTCADMAGTFGYLAPECFTCGEVDEKVDVYAFGVVLLELLSGRKPVCSDCPKGEESLVLWAKPILKSWKFEQVLDSSLGENYNTDEMERMCLAAFLCIRQVPGYRPNIALVLKLLNGEDEAIEWAKLASGTSMAPHETDDETATNNSNIQSHINLALLGIDEDDKLSSSSGSNSSGFSTSNTTLDEYLKEILSRSSSFSL